MVRNSHVLTHLFSREVSFFVKATYALFNHISTEYWFYALSSTNFFKIHFSKTNFKDTRVSNSLDPDQAWQNARPDLGPNCLQKGYQQRTLVRKELKMNFILLFNHLKFYCFNDKK